eukprot:2715190-Amphidinium_carterae.1
MELKIAYQQVHRTVIENRNEYKQTHFHDYSVITTKDNLDTEYAVKMTVDIFKQAERKNDPTNPAYKNRFFVFRLQHYRDRVRDIFRRAEARTEDYNNAVDYFDDRGGTHFARPNRRTLEEIRRSQQEDIKMETRRAPREMNDIDIEDFVEEDFTSETEIREHQEHQEVQASRGKATQRRRTRRR